MSVCARIAKGLAISTMFICMGQAGNPPASTPEQSAAITKMIQTQDAVVKDLNDSLPTRAHTSEFMDLRRDATRTALCVHLMGAATAEERKTLLTAYVETARQGVADIQARIPIDATESEVHAARFALAEAKAFQAGLPVALPSALPTLYVAVADKDQQIACQEMVTEAQATIDGLNKLVDIRTRSPEFLSVRLVWQRKLLEAQLLTPLDGVAKIKAVNGFRDAVQGIQKEVLARVPIDTTTASMELANGYVAQAEYVEAVFPSERKRPELQPAERAALEKALAAASKEYTGILDIENIRSHSPEFIQLKISVIFRCAEFKLALAKPDERAGILDELGSRISTINNPNAIVDWPPPTYLDIPARARAQFDYLKASLK